MRSVAKGWLLLKVIEWSTWICSACMAITDRKTPQSTKRSISTCLRMKHGIEFWGQKVYFDTSSLCPGWGGAFWQLCPRDDDDGRRPARTAAGVPEAHRPAEFRAILCVSPAVSRPTHITNWCTVPWSTQPNRSWDSVLSQSGGGDDTVLGLTPNHDGICVGPFFDSRIGIKSSVKTCWHPTIHPRPFLPIGFVLDLHSAPPKITGFGVQCKLIWLPQPPFWTTCLSGPPQWQRQAVAGRRRCS